MTSACDTITAYTIVFFLSLYLAILLFSFRSWQQTFESKKVLEPHSSRAIRIA